MIRDFLPKALDFSLRYFAGGTRTRRGGRFCERTGLRSSRRTSLRLRCWRSADWWLTTRWC